MASITMQDAQTRLPELLERIPCGSEFIVVGNDEQPVAKIVRLKPDAPYRFEMGWMKGSLWMAEDFDAPLEEFREYMKRNW